MNQWSRESILNIGASLWWGNFILGPVVRSFQHSLTDLEVTKVKKDWLLVYREQDLEMEDKTSEVL